MTPREVLLAAAALIEPPGAWTRGVMARDADGGGRIPSSSLAVCWCARGAISRVAPDCDAYFDTAWALSDVVGVNIGDWNDAPGRTQAEVVAALRAAAERCA